LQKNDNNAEVNLRKVNDVWVGAENVNEYVGVAKKGN